MATTRPLKHRLAVYALLLGGLLLLIGSPGMLEHHFIYFPEHQVDFTPADLGLVYQEVEFPAADGTRLHGWLLPGHPGRPLILFCHGNAGNIAHRVDNLAHFQRLGLPVFIFDYRGYGRSAGRADEQGTYQDARGALAWLESQGWQPQQMVYFGRSLGAAVALQLALEAPPAGLVLETPFPSIAAMGWHHNPILYALFGWSLKARYSSIDKIGQLRAPLLVFQGDRDRIVPPRMAHRLFDYAPQPKRLVLIPGAGHNDTYDVGGEDYWREWQRFLASLGGPAGGEPAQ